MLNRIHLLTAACLVTSAGLFLAAPVTAQNLGQSVNSAAARTTDRDVSLPAGITPKDLNSDRGIERAFKAVSEDAMDKTGFDNLVARLVEQDRERVKKSLTSGSLNNIDGSKNKALTDLIADIDGSWKSKYNQGFSIDTGKVFTSEFLHIQTGEVNDSQMLLGKWPVNANGMAVGDTGKLTQSDVDQARKAFGGDVKLEKGRNVAIAHLLADHGMTGINASMIDEAGGWKFDVPNDLTAQKLYDNLVRNLTYIDSHKNQWPADVNEGYRDVAHAVTAALYDVPMNASTGTAVNR